MVQTELVRDLIQESFPELEIELVPMSTRGDKILDRSLTSFGGKGVFTKELEEALLDGTVDLAVHSAKDMPMEFPRGLALGAVLARANPGDVLVTRSGILARQLPAGSVIGTSSLRRELQIKKMNPQVQVKLLRGNVQTRLEKLKNGEYDGILLAAAGLERLGYENPEGLHLEYLDKEQFIPAPGQGILAVEIRAGELAKVMAAIHCEDAAVMLKAEREYLTVLGGGCNAPCGAYCRREGERLVMSAMYAADGKHPVYRKEAWDVGAAGGMSADDGTGAAADVGAAGGAGAADMPALAERLARDLAVQVRCRTVSLVGAGPGDAGLFTKKGLECVRRADVIVYDNLISGSILNEARLDAELFYAGKRSSNHYLTQDQINALLVEQAQLGKYVVRLKGGDPFIFGRGGEEAMVLEEHGIPFEIVPGISSSYSVPAYAGIPVTQRGMASSFHVITGHEGAHKTEEVLDYATLAKEEGTLIFLMGLKNLGKIADQLMAHGKPKDTPAAVIQQGTTARQEKAVSTLEHIVEEAENCGIQTPAITVVGAVVSLEGSLEWFGQKPLSRTRVLVTGTRYMVKELSRELDGLGAETVAVSVIESLPIMDEAVKTACEGIDSYQWLVFTSGNGVEIFFDTMKKLSVDLRRLMHLKFAAVGKSTAAVLAAHGFACDFVPSKFSGADLAKEWIPQLGKDDKVLLMRAREGSAVLPQALWEAGQPFTDVALYETWVDVRRGDELNRAVRDVDYVTVASASAVRAFCELVPEYQSLEAKVISIGPSTTKAAKELGLAVYQSASEYTAEGMAAAIVAKEMQNWAFVCERPSRMTERNDKHE